MTTVTKKIKRDFHIPPKANTCAKFELCRLLGGLARECDGRTDGRTPGEYSANSGPARLVPGPELSNSANSGLTKLNRNSKVLLGLTMVGSD